MHTLKCLQSGEQNTKHEGILSKRISKSDKMREVGPQMGGVAFLRRSQPCKDVVDLYLFQPFICSSISVSHPLPLPVCLSSLNKQTRSSCQLRPTPPSWNQPITTCPNGISAMQLLTCRLQSCAQCTMHVCSAGQRNKHGWISPTLFDAFFRSFFFFALCIM